MNDEITPDTEADATPAAGDDTEGHIGKNHRVSEAGDDDTEGHIGKNHRVSEAGDDDTEGHAHRR